MKWLPFLWILLIIPITVKSEVIDSSFYFSGYILDEDSIPVENALLVSINTKKTCPTNNAGYFRIFIYNDDSIKINHISFGQKVIYPNKLSYKENIFILKFDPYQLIIVNVKFDNKELMKKYEILQKKIWPSLNKSGFELLNIDLFN